MSKYKKFLALTLLLSIFLTTGFTQLMNSPKTVYRVYLKGKSLGLIESKSELENYIDKEQQEIKEKYGVDKVYVPTDLDIIKEVTYYGKVSTVEDIYNDIKDISPFTISGYQITIKGIDTKDSEGKDVEGVSQKIYVLDRDVFISAVDKTVKAFIPEEKYNSFADETQPEIIDTGSTIQSIYIENKITIKQTNIPVDKTIYMNKETLSQYLLFGTTEPQSTYTVQDGDTIETVSFNNKVSTEEFLIANPKFTSSESLLFPGQTVTIGILRPQMNIIEEDYVVKDVETNFSTETTQDPNQYTDYSQVTQEGQNGLSRVTQIIQKVNGEQTTTVPVSTEVLKEPVTKKVIEGSKPRPVIPSGCSGAGCNVVVTSGYYAWPAACSTISSPFGWRWGTLHDGTDIAGCGYGSNIYAAASGVVEKVSVKYDNGYYIVIHHPNNTWTMYAHLCAGCQYVHEGQEVVRGQVIGGMGATGAATGVHLHFQIWLGGFPYAGGRVVNAMQYY